MKITPKQRAALAQIRASQRAGEIHCTVEILDDTFRAMLADLDAAESRFRECVGGSKRDLHKRLEDQRKKNERLTAENATLRQQLAASDAALIESRANDREAMRQLVEAQKDVERLDALDQEGVSYGFQDMHEGNRWEFDGPFATLRAYADCLLAALENQS